MIRLFQLKLPTVTSTQQSAVRKHAGHMWPCSWTTLPYAVKLLLVSFVKSLAAYVFCICCCCCTQYFVKTGNITPNLGTVTPNIYVNGGQTAARWHGLYASSSWRAITQINSKLWRNIYCLCHSSKCLHEFLRLLTKESTWFDVVFYVKRFVPNFHSLPDCICIDARNWICDLLVVLVFCKNSSTEQVCPTLIL